MKAGSLKHMMRYISIFSLAVCIGVFLWGFQSGVFTSPEKMEETISRCGIWGPSLFILFQAVQVVFPVLPGGIGCLAGIILFGTIQGFLYNYTGICAGSLIAFAIAKNWGRPFLSVLFGENLLNKYENWTKEKKTFERFFAAAIFLPVAPDDFLCYLAGTTAMSWRRFVLIILTGKPFAIFLYSFLLDSVWNQLLIWIG